VLLIALPPLLVVLGLALDIRAVARSPTSAPSRSTIVSITFDDGSASQYATSAMLGSRGMRGTYYINSGLVGSSRYYMTWPQVHALAAEGNEIGGHTLHHENLTKVDLATARTEVCDDRTNLLKEGFAATSFAYPEAGANSVMEQMVKECGYKSGRGVGNLHGAKCPCPYAETIPPRDPYSLRTADGATNATTLQDLQGSVAGAEEHGGGWVPLTFHGICDDSCTRGTSVSTEIFTQFLDWLASRRNHGTVVQTVGQVMQQAPEAGRRSVALDEPTGAAAAGTVPTPGAATPARQQQPGPVSPSGRPATSLLPSENRLRQSVAEEASRARP